MRKINSYLVIFIFTLLSIHGVLGAFTLLRLTELQLTSLAYTLLAAVIAHGLLGIAMTKDAIKEGLRSGHWYLKENASFWTIRLTGLIILLSLWFHVTCFTVFESGALFLREFTVLRLLSQVIFVLAIFIHLYCAAKPLLLKWGILSYRQRRQDFLLVFSIFGAFFMASLISYFLYWNY